MKICIIKLSAMGDIIHTMVALQFIKKQIPNAQIDWIVEESFKQVLQFNPHINRVLTVNLKAIKKNKSEIINQYKLLKKYGNYNYDVVIDAQGLFKSAIATKIVGSRVVGSYTVGFDKNSIREKIASYFYDKKVAIGYDKNVIERSVKVICQPLGIDTTKEDIFNKEPFLFFKDAGKLENGYVLLVVGASRPNKIYPKEKFLEVCKKLDERILVVWGNDEEKQTASWLSEQCENITMSAKGDLNFLKIQIANAKLVIGGDTGPTHMAWALNIPSITIFGNTPGYRNTYTTDINRVIESNSVVNPLKLDKTDFSICDISPDEIVQLAKELIC
jgi:heptosyltransferase-1